MRERGGMREREKGEERFIYYSNIIIDNVLLKEINKNIIMFFFFFVFDRIYKNIYILYEKKRLMLVFYMLGKKNIFILINRDNKVDNLCVINIFLFLILCL